MLQEIGAALGELISDYLGGRAVNVSARGMPVPSGISIFSPFIRALDVAGYNSEDHWSVDYWSDHVRVPGRVMLGTESFPSASFQ